jgi:thiosulfate reductase cytochrome b subunit
LAEWPADPGPGDTIRSQRVMRIQEKHPLALRIFHWLNFPILAGMIWSGLLIYWAYPAYRIGAGGFTLVHFFPQWFYKLFHIPYRLAEGMAWHFTFMWLFALNGLAYAVWSLASGHWREIAPRRRTWREAWQVVLHDLHLRKTAPPAGKFNAAQRIAYTAVALMGAGALATGLAIYKPVQFSWLDRALGGYRAARLEHFLLAMGFVAFFFLHIVQVIRAGWNNFRSIVAGFEIVETAPEDPDD